MSRLEVQGASLYYESVGQGPVLLCISGGDGSCEIWKGFAENLKDHFTVIMWDRRGFSRSYLTGAQDYDHRIETDVDDAYQLIKHHSPQEQVTVVGNSSGAIVSLKLLIHHPEVIRTLVSYEPPLARVLPDFNELWAQQEDIYNTYRRFGIPPALQKFAEITKSDTDAAVLMRAMDPRNGPYIFSNVQYWFEREFLVYPKQQINIDAELRPVKEKLMLVNGELTNPEAYQYRGNAAIGKELGLEVILFPGAHVGHATHAKHFAQKLLESLKTKNNNAPDLS